VDFSGIERYIDTPVNRYSSGMYVRLAFAVAAHLESEILIVDEVLAVGDAEFQKKCLGKMGDASNQDGRTVLFVSHNMAAIQALCSKAILLENGHLTLSGSPAEVVSGYLNSDSKLWIDRDLSCITTRKGGNSNLRFTSYDVVDLQGKSLDAPTCGSKVRFIVNFQVIFGYVDNLRVGISFKDRNTGDTVTQLNSYYGSSDVLSFNQGNHSYIFTVNHLPLSPDQYIVSFIATSGLEVLDWLEEGGELIVSEGLFYDSGKMPLDPNAQIFFTEYSCGPSSSFIKRVS
jgi:lipopolysaccharide transport system ATP-binding protein